MPNKVEFRFPDETTPTASWVPALDYADRRELPARGVLTQRTGDPLVTHTYKMGRRGRVWTLEFDPVPSSDPAVPESDDDDLATFEAAVDGKSFRFFDSLKAAWRTVKLAGDIERGRSRVPKHVTLTVTLLEVAS